MISIWKLRVLYVWIEQMLLCLTLCCIVISDSAMLWRMIVFFWNGMELLMLLKELLPFDEYKSIVQLFVYSLLSEINIFSLSFVASKNNQTSVFHNLNCSGQIIISQEIQKRIAQLVHSSVVLSWATLIQITPKYLLYLCTHGIAAFDIQGRRASLYH
jgi:hypothetical protein